MSDALIKLDKASLFIPGTKERVNVLHDIDLEIHANCHYGLLGANGSGKSTLLRLLHGDLWLSSGSIVWRDGNNYSASPIVAKEITALVSPLVQEQYQRNAWQVTVRDMLLGGMAGKPPSYANLSGSAEAEEEIVRIMSELEAREWLNLLLPELSQGQLRLVLLVRALLRQPPILLLDEFADGLDRNRKEKFFALLRSIAPRTAMVFASHRGDSLPCVDRLFEMRKGHLFKVEKLSDMPRAKAPLPHQKTAPGQILCQLEKVSVYIDRKKILRDIDWAIHRGENWQVTGDNGSGKSTLLRLLAGNEFCAAGGSIRYFSARLGRPPASLQEKRRLIHLVSDAAQALYGYPLTALELVCSGHENSIGLYHEPDAAVIAKARKHMEFFFRDEDMNALGKTSIRRLSSGQLRRLFLARALMGEPELLLLDEPCSGLDAQSREYFLNLLNELGTTGIYGSPVQFILVSHYEEDLPPCVSCLARMRRGRLEVS